MNYSNTPETRQLLGRDLNYLRDVALFWPFVLYLTFAGGAAFSPADRNLALECAAVSITALLLACERLFMFFVGMGYIASQCAIFLLLHRWNWAAFAVGILTGGPVLAANRYWRKPRLAYKVPDEFRLIDTLWSIASICGSLLIGFVFGR